MPDMTTQEALALIKKVGTELEKKLNETIQTELNREDLLILANIAAPLIKKFYHQSQEISEFLSVPLNYATKKDFLRLANLTIQMEEKLDQIESFLYEFAKKENPADLPLPKQADPAPSALNKQTQLSEGEKRKRLLKEVLLHHALGTKHPLLKEASES
ncbi:hypothetical protein [Metabacillus sp. 84]|uniref:hypothetical protein n=1 Tax=unclassified Metabacillus TaxID=2675274 RepID=UPI003CF62DD4